MGAAIIGVGIVLVIGAVLFVPVLYGFVGYATYRMGRRLGHEALWRAWVPVLYVFYLCEMAQKPDWWALIILLVPGVNIVVLALVLTAIARRLNQPPWVGI